MKILESNMNLLGLVLIALIVMFYSYNTDKPILEGDLILVEGSLGSKPKLITQGGDMPYYEIELKLKNNNKDFSLANCGYDLVNKNQILDINVGQQIHCQVNKSEYREEDDVKIYSLRIDNKVIFKLADFNRCYVNYWKHLIPIVIIILLILFYRILKGIGFIERIKRNINNGN